MLKQTSQPIRFSAPFTASKQGKTGLSPTVTIYRDGVLLLTGASASEIGSGLYSYTLSGASTVTAGNYIAVFETVDTSVDSQVAYSFYAVGENWAQNVDAPVSTRSTLTAAQVWDHGSRTLTGFGTLVADVASAAASAVWNAGARTLSAFGFTVNTNPNATETAMADDTDAMRARLAEQVPEPTPVLVVPAPTLPGRIVVYYDTTPTTGVPTAGVRGVAKYQGKLPITVAGTSDLTREGSTVVPEVVAESDADGRIAWEVWPVTSLVDADGNQPSIRFVVQATGLNASADPTETADLLTLI